ncbi:cell wall hydrolase [Ectothiorhodospira shaposhnikovii]|uniref:cell wall hydrolase n=1 Tax=Ectothiorhodospira shaposhnikovii TaxID=1054 RepID=UPI001EE8288F|nr:cell wall hydrolase [Ectothiorhodospira shaposhnikovii]MCG5512805.1 cell wall hydrolase [Ectothiorhodospira shaposhnikovii]
MKSKRFLKSALAAAVLAITPTQAPAIDLQTLCLATNIYHEARGESGWGQAAVGMVTLNRVDDPRWPDTVCEVVFQDRQFSWVGVMYRMEEPLAWDRALMIANTLMAYPEARQSFPATHYVHRRLDQRVVWTRDLERLYTIGNHVFYR